MTGDRRGLEDEAPPPASRSGRLALFFALTGAPLAWFVQHNSNYGLLGQPCYPGPDRNRSLPEHALWVWPASVVIFVLCVAVGLAATLIAIRLYRRARAADPEGRDSRNCFLAYSGIISGVGFTTMVLSNGIPMLLVPPCAL